MYIPFEEFEKVMTQCSEVFTAWDDEYDKLQGLMRDIVKKKRDEHLKMVWRVNFSHKRLQERMSYMVKFRRQHDIRITNQIIYLHLHIKDCRYNVLQQLFAWQAFVTSHEQDTEYQVLAFTTLFIMNFAHHALTLQVPGRPGQTHHPDLQEPPDQAAPWRSQSPPARTPSWFRRYRRWPWTS